VRRFWRALALAGLAGLALAGPAAAHAQLISSSPGAGEVVAEPPTELRLVFSEPVDPAFAGVDLLDADGATVALGIGAPDAADQRLFVAPLPPLGEGLYTANWQVLSAADGHVTNGFVTFGVGDVEVIGVARDAGGGGLHVGHTPLIATLDAASRAAGYLGALLAFGLGLIAAAVLLPALGRWPIQAIAWSVAFLALAATAAAGGIVVGASGLAGKPSAGLIEFATATRTGQLLLAQGGVGLVGAVMTVVLIRRAGASRAFAASSAAGASCLVLIALRSHAAASEAIGPLLADVVHLAAAGTWLAGVLGLVTLAAGRLGDAAPGEALRRAVPRFSALALVSIGLLVATGIYAAWLQIGDPAALGTDYGLVLLAKLGVVAAALALGATNYFDAGRDLPIAGGLRRRVGAELALAVVVVILTANLTTGSPPAQVSTVDVPVSGGTSALALALQPGTPGPNRVLVSVPEAAALHTDRIELQLERLDQIGTSRIALRPDPTAAHGTRFVADGLLLPARSSWSAAVVVRDLDGVETGRARFAYALDDDRVVVDGGFRLDPGLLIAGVLLLGALIGLGYRLGGGGLPRTDPWLGRLALLVGGLSGLLLGVVFLLSEPMR
jgi:copper transport protein